MSKQRQNFVDSKEVKLSKFLSRLLRHSAIRDGYRMTSDGYLNVDDILQHPFLKNNSVDDIRQVVANNNKQRFSLRDHFGCLQIKANQGHSILVPELELTPIISASQVTNIIHGTYKRFWDKIKEQGLSRMNRVHIHFSNELPSSAKSGIRKNCEILIYIDINKALKDQIKFFQSSNNVILSPGNNLGIISTNYFLKVLEYPSGKNLPI